MIVVEQNNFCLRHMMLVYITDYLVCCGITSELVLSWNLEQLETQPISRNQIRELNGV